MPPRIRPQLQCLQPLLRSRNELSTQQCRYASVATATAPAPSLEEHSHTIQRYPSTQPPSFKPPEFRKSQLLRQYAALLSSTPLILLFQHNNLKALEWLSIRRELAQALRKVDEAEGTHHADFVKLHIVQTGMFAAAMRVVEFHHPEKYAQEPASEPRHVLSKKAHSAARNAKLKHGFEPLLSGPIAVLALPDVSPAHLKAALQVLSPSEKFPAPKRRTNPSYHELPVQEGLKKLMLMGARAEGRIFDLDGARWIGGIEGGKTGLQAQLVAILQSFGANLSQTLEAASKSLWFTLEGRKSMLEDEGKEKEEPKKEEPKKEEPKQEEP
jgi:large subunit ribosomal protein L10